MDPLRRFRLSATLLLIILAVGTVGFRVLEGMSPVDAFYMTVITLSTVGFSEVKPLGSTGKLFTILLIFAGAGVLLWTLANLHELLISEQLWHSLRRRKMQKNIEQMHDHYIVCGYGRMGRQVASDFKVSRVPFVIVEIEEGTLAEVAEDRTPHVAGDATKDETLRLAGIERAKGLIAVVNSDADNVMAVVSARGLKPDLFIVARAATEEAEAKLKRAGANQVVSPYTTGGRRIALAVLRPAVCDFVGALLYDEALQAEMQETSIAPQSGLAGQSLIQAGFTRENRKAPIAILRGSQHIISPAPDMVLQSNDSIIFITTGE
ncbi:MAG: NAD-binding protein [Armatimonadetes bacterium]|nr:NAD-binding protein [Armatimonadota bacterium]